MNFLSSGRPDPTRPDPTRPDPARGVDQPGFQALLAMARNGRTAVKLSGWQKFSRESPPWDDTRPFVDALLQAFTLDACLWASDWPFLRAPQRLDVGRLLRNAERLLPDAADRQKLRRRGAGRGFEPPASRLLVLVWRH